MTFSFPAGDPHSSNCCLILIVVFSPLVKTLVQRASLPGGPSSVIPLRSTPRRGATMNRHHHDPSGLMPIERDACAIICYVNKAARPTHGNMQRTIEALVR